MKRECLVKNGKKYHHHHPADRPRPTDPPFIDPTVWSLTGFLKNVGSIWLVDQILLGNHCFWPKKYFNLSDLGFKIMSTSKIIELGRCSYVIFMACGSGLIKLHRSYNSSYLIMVYIFSCSPAIDSNLWPISLAEPNKLR